MSGLLACALDTPPPAATVAESEEAVDAEFFFIERSNADSEADSCDM